MSHSPNSHGSRIAWLIGTLIALVAAGTGFGDWMKFFRPQAANRTSGGTAVVESLPGTSESDPTEPKRVTDPPPEDSPDPPMVSRSPFAGSWAGAWRGGGQYGGLTFVISADGEMEGELTNGTLYLSTPVSGTLSSAGTFDFTYQYPNSPQGKMTGRATIGVNGLLNGVARVYFDEQFFCSVVISVVRQ